MRAKGIRSCIWISMERDKNTHGSGTHTKNNELKKVKYSGTSFMAVHSVLRWPTLHYQNEPRR